MGEPMCFVSLLAPAHFDTTWLPSYLAGLTEQEAARLQASEFEPGEAAEILPFLQRDAVDAFRVLAGCESAVSDPQGYAAGCFPQITLQPTHFTSLVQDWYSPNFRVMRALLGKQLTGKLRKDLDVVAESTGARLRECWRHFDNIRRVFNCLDDLDFSCAVYPTVRERFRLGPRLAWLYTSALFLLRHRMNVTDSRRRLAAVPCETLIDLASAMIIHWTAGAGSAFPPDVAGRALLLLQQPPALPRSTSAGGDGSFASLPPPIALPPAVSTTGPLPVKTTALTPGQGGVGSSTAPSFAAARSAAAAAVPTVLAVANARSLRSGASEPPTNVTGRQGSDASVDGRPTTTAYPGLPHGWLSASQRSPDASEAPAAHTVVDVAAIAAGLAPSAHPPLLSSRSADDAPYGAVPLSAHHKASATPVAVSSGGALRVFHTAMLDTGGAAAALAAAATTTGLASALRPPVQPQSSSSLGAGVDTPAPASVGLGLDLAFVLSLKDFAGRLMRTRPERVLFCEAVLSAYFVASSGTLHAQGHAIARSSTLTPLGESQRKRLEARLPGLLKALRDMAVNLGAPAEFRDYFEDVVHVLDECVLAGLQRDDMRRLLASVADASAALPHVSSLPLTARGAYVSQWTRFLAVVDYCAARMWSAVVGTSLSPPN